MFSKPAAQLQCCCSIQRRSTGELQHRKVYSYHCVSKQTITYHTVGYSGWGAVVVVEEGLVLLRQGEEEEVLLLLLLPLPLPC